ncbi:MAG: hypothetical protein HOK79_01605 [Cryomorphaceae bacterium]|nr:hypothetical protein [Cryomorphaceae bacterium]
MRKTTIYLTIFLLIFSSCSKEDEIQLLDIVSEKFENLYAPQNGGVNQRTGQYEPVSGEFTKFNFSTGQITTSDTDWDVAFRATTIIVNGGVSLETIDEPTRTGNSAVYIANGTMSSVTNVDLMSLTQDSSNGYAVPTGGGNGWYTYQGPPVNLISPTPGKILVFRTNDGKYAKMEILSYYKDAPENPDAYTDETPYYTFSFVYQPNEGVTSF